MSNEEIDNILLHMSERIDDLEIENKVLKIILMNTIKQLDKSQRWNVIHHSTGMNTAMNLLDNKNILKRQAVIDEILTQVR